MLPSAVYTLLMRIALITLLLLPLVAPAIEPAEVVVVYNSADSRSKGVAEHYATKRGVPAENLVGLPLPGTEDISRADYDAKLAGPLRQKLALRREQVKVILTVWGVPLRVGPVIPTAAEKAEAAKAQAAAEEATKSGDAKTAATQTQQWAVLSGDQSVAAVDSELMLLWWPRYSPARWVFNPLYWRVKPEDRAKAPPVLLTSRLDGPSHTLARRLVDDALAAEAAGGPTGKAYIDARGIPYDAKKGMADNGTGLDGYDQSFREAAAHLKKGGLEVVLDDKEPVFGPGTCPDAGLYAGWYALVNYVPSLTLNKGAIAWHLASGEAISLRDRESKYWCPRLLMDGAAVTLGPVAEPYTVGFPKPAEFFGFLLTGKYTLVECYARTTLLTSWMTVLVGDPLYNPYKTKPRLQEADVFPSPRGVK